MRGDERDGISHLLRTSNRLLFLLISWSLNSEQFIGARDVCN